MNALLDTKASAKRKIRRSAVVCAIELRLEPSADREWNRVQRCGKKTPRSGPPSAFAGGKARKLCGTGEIVFAHEVADIQIGLLSLDYATHPRSTLTSHHFRHTTDHADGRAN